MELFDLQLILDLFLFLSQFNLFCAHFSGRGFLLWLCCDLDFSLSLSLGNQLFILLLEFFLEGIDNLF